MPSTSLQALQAALEEVVDLGNASHPNFDPKTPESLRLARAIGRGQIVLLSSHFERYIYSLNEELVTFLNAHRLKGDRVPDIVRLQHSMIAIDELGKTGWENRKEKLVEFVEREAWIWTASQNGMLNHEHLLTWMKTPKPKELMRFFKLWGTADIFKNITRKESARGKMWLELQGLVDLRNNIAHGDVNAQATQSDVKRYIKAIREFCERADKCVAGRVAKLYHIAKPW